MTLHPPPRSREEAEAIAAVLAPCSLLTLAELVAALWLPLDDGDVADAKTPTDRRRPPLPRC